MSQKAKNFYPGVILYCDNEQLVLEEKYSHFHPKNCQNMLANETRGLFNME